MGEISQEEIIDILLVEDNPYDEELALHALRKNNLINKIHVVRDGEEALDFIFCSGSYAKRDINETPKLILLDINLPKINGVEVLRRIKNDPRTCLIPVVVLTTSREENDIISAYESGTNGYVVKPVDFDQFMETIRQLGFYWMFLNMNPQKTATVK